MEQAGGVKMIAQDICKSWTEYCEGLGGTPDSDDYLCVLIDKALNEYQYTHEALVTAKELAQRFVISMNLAGVAPQEYSHEPLAEQYFLAVKLLKQIAEIGDGK
jgi:hypothetical protein